MKPRRGPTDGARIARPLPTNRRATPATPEAATPDFDESLGELIDDDRRDRARGDLRDRDLQRTMQRDTATFSGILRDLAEQQLSVVLEHAEGRIAGRIVTLATDHVVLESRGSGERAFVRLSAVITLAPEVGVLPPDSVGRREVAHDWTLRDALAEAADERPDVLLVLAGRSQLLAGQLRAVGEDVLTLVRPERPSGRTFVPINHIIRAVIRP
jgi:hypothetical protein